MTLVTFSSDVFPFAWYTLGRYPKYYVKEANKNWEPHRFPHNSKLNTISEATSPSGVDTARRRPARRSRGNRNRGRHTCRNRPIRACRQSRKVQVQTSVSPLCQSPSRSLRLEAETEHAADSYQNQNADGYRPDAPPAQAQACSSACISSKHA